MVKYGCSGMGLMTAVRPHRLITAVKAATLLVLEALLLNYLPLESITQTFTTAPGPCNIPQHHGLTLLLHEGRLLHKAQHTLRFFAGILSQFLVHLVKYRPRKALRP